MSSSVVSAGSVGSYLRRALGFAFSALAMFFLISFAIRSSSLLDIVLSCRGGDCSEFTPYPCHFPNECSGPGYRPSRTAADRRDRQRLRDLGSERRRN